MLDVIKAGTVEKRYFFASTKSNNPGGRLVSGKYSMLFYTLYMPNYSGVSNGSSSVFNFEFDATVFSNPQVMDFHHFTPNLYIYGADESGKSFLVNFSITNSQRIFIDFSVLEQSVRILDIATSTKISEKLWLKNWVRTTFMVGFSEDI